MSIITGLITISSTAAQQGPATPIANNFVLRMSPASTGIVWMGGTSGAASSSGGYPLQGSEQTSVQVRALDALWFAGSSGLDVYFHVLN